MCHTQRPEEESYEAISMAQLFKGEGCKRVWKARQHFYEDDSLYKHCGEDDCPSGIKRMLNIYGVDVPTEHAFALRVNTIRRQPMIGHPGEDLTMRFALDDEAELREVAPRYEMTSGVIEQKSETNQGDGDMLRIDDGHHGGEFPPPSSGDGVVPLDSLKHSESWSQQVEVKTITLPRANHSGILSDPRFLGVLRNTLGCTDPRRPSDKFLKVTIISARGLRHADVAALGQGTSDPYCVCGIPPKKHTEQSTDVVYDNLKPVWNHVLQFKPGDYDIGDSLAFSVWDSDQGFLQVWGRDTLYGKLSVDKSTDDFLGSATLISSRFRDRGFEGELKLHHAGKSMAGNPIEAYLKVKVEILDERFFESESESESSFTQERSGLCGYNMSL